MRRKDREIRDPEQLEEILKECAVVRIGAQDEEGMFVVPMNFGYQLEGEKLTLYVHSAPEGRKVTSFRKGGTVAFEMDCGHALRTADTACGHSFSYQSIMGTGTVAEVQDAEEKQKALEVIMAHLTGQAWAVPSQGAERTAVFAIHVTAWTGKANQPT